mmetsp:Transcript_8040/g.10077  ORF Transcript_8040/g.10077 Transcript_8040/m.10077 type:complete len:303 (+) Transcript_8040:617-1525(+)
MSSSGRSRNLISTTVSASSHSDSSLLPKCDLINFCMRVFGRLPFTSSAVAAVWLHSCSSASTTSLASLSFVSSRSSLIVNATWPDPRRPTILIRSTAFPSSGSAASTSNAWEEISVEDSSVASALGPLPDALRFFAQALAMILAQSRATLPWPRITTSGQRFSAPRIASVRWTYSGCPLYQLTKARAVSTPSKREPGIPIDRSSSAPYASTTAAKLSCRSLSETMGCVSSPSTLVGHMSPRRTLPRNLNRGSEATTSKSSTTFFTSGWSGATPNRTRPKGVGKRSRSVTDVTASFRRRYLAV